MGLKWSVSGLGVMGSVLASCLTRLGGAYASPPLGAVGRSRTHVVGSRAAGSYPSHSGGGSGYGYEYSKSTWKCHVAVGEWLRRAAGLAGWRRGFEPMLEQFLISGFQVPVRGPEWCPCIGSHNPPGYL